MASIFSKIYRLYNSFYLCMFILFQSRSIGPFFCMRKFSIPGAIRIAGICEVGLKRFRCGEDALGVRFGGKTHPVGVNARQPPHEHHIFRHCYTITNSVTFSGRQNRLAP
jgi:hypothetical protein